MQRYFVLIAILSIGMAGMLLTNGDFEQPFTEGWLKTKSGFNTAFERATNYDPDPDYEVYVYKGSDHGYARLYQITNMGDMPVAEIDFSVQAKLYAYDNDPEAFTGAAVELMYLDGAGGYLGNTKICARSTQCPWTNTSTQHIIPASGSGWYNYAFNINDEIGNLPGVNPADVKKIQVSLLDSTYHC